MQKNSIMRLFMLVMAMLFAVPASTGCSWWAENKDDVKSVVQTVDDIAQALCGVFYGDKMNISAQDAVKSFCDTREKYEPWIDQVLSGAKTGGDIKMKLGAGKPGDTAAKPVPPVAPVQSLPPTVTPPVETAPVPAEVIDPRAPTPSPVVEPPPASKSGGKVEAK